MEVIDLSTEMAQVPGKQDEIAVEIRGGVTL